jgi:hypothetical protein
MLAGFLPAENKTVTGGAAQFVLHVLERFEPFGDLFEDFRNPIRTSPRILHARKSDPCPDFEGD